MVQGAGLKNLKKASKSAGSQRHKGAGKYQAKGRKQKNACRPHAVNAAKPQVSISKSINKKNESVVAAKAVACGMKFSLTDLTDKGTKEQKAQLKARDKKQDKSTKLTGRLKDQIAKLKQGTKTR